MKKFLSFLLVLTMVLFVTACGKEDIPNESKTNDANGVTTGDEKKPGDDKEKANTVEGPYSGYDVSEPVNVVMYVLGDRPVDMDKVLEKVNNEYLIPDLNSTLEVNFLSFADYQTQYSLVLVGNDPVDLIYTSDWCFYGEESSKGAFKELTMDWIKEWMPQSYASQPSYSWEQISLDGKVFAIPRNHAVAEKQLVVFREDLRQKYDLAEINSWATLKDYLYTVAKNEPALQANAAAGEASNLLGVFWRTLPSTEVVVGYDFHYIHDNSGSAPSPEDIFYWPTSDYFKEHAIEMAEFAKNNVWSRNAINNSIHINDAFVQGTSATVFNNLSTILQLGKQMEEAGTGIYGVADISPNTKARLQSFAGDALAITFKSKNPERAALVLDYLKNDVALNTLFTGGIEGEHYVLEDGLRSSGPAADNYPWDNHGWAIRTSTLPKSADTDQRQLDLAHKLESNAFSTVIDGFSFNSIPVQTELALLSSIRNEYYQSLQLGVFGDKTEEAFEEYRQRFAESGVLEIVQDELIRQYVEYCAEKGISY